MKPYRKWNFEHDLGAPKNWNADRDGPCESLPVARTSGIPGFQSLWQLTWRERFRLLFGGKVVLTVTGRSHPPVALEVTD